MALVEMEARAAALISTRERCLKSERVKTVKFAVNDGSGCVLLRLLNGELAVLANRSSQLWQHGPLFALQDLK